MTVKFTFGNNSRGDVPFGAIGLSEQEITDFEKEIHWQLPTDYRDILKAVDGGYGKIGG